jgi:hypothetical protein
MIVSRLEDAPRTCPVRCQRKDRVQECLFPHRCIFYLNFILVFDLYDGGRILKDCVQKMFISAQNIFLNLISCLGFMGKAGY